MFTPSLSKNNPEQVFLTVQNNDPAPLLYGHGVFYDLLVYTQTTAPAFNGYQVKYGLTTAANQVPPDLFAGIVAGRDINPSEWGMVQCYGYHPAVAYTNANAPAVPFSTTLFTVSTRTGGGFTNAVLVPGQLYANTTGAASGYLQAIVHVSTHTTTDVLDVQALVAQGRPRVIPLGNLNGFGTVTSGSTGTVKAFIRCM